MTMRALCVPAVAVAALLAGCGGGGSSITASTDSVREWERLSVSPLPSRTRTVLAWTGKEVLVLGGDRFSCPPAASCVAPTETPLADAAAFNPQSNEWRTLRSAPVGFHSAAGPVVIDEQVFLLAHTDYETGVELLRYDVESDAWDSVEPPASNPAWYQLVAAGDRLVAHVGTEETGLTGDIIFDPSTGDWEPLPDDPLTPGFDRTMVWAEPHLYLFDKENVPNPGSERPSVVRAARLDLERLEWERLPDSELIGGWGAWLADRGKLITPYLGEAGGGESSSWGRSYPYGGILDVDRSTWEPLPSPPAAVRDAPAGAVPPTAGAVGDEAAVFLDTHGWLLDARSGSWTSMPQIPQLDEQETPPLLAAGRTAIAFVRDALWHYTPDHEDRGDESESTTTSFTSTTSTAAAMTPCAAGDLAAAIEMISNRLSSGNGYAWIVVANRSDEPCTIQGVPGVAFLDENGNHLAIVTEPGNFETVDPPVTDDPIVLAPHLDASREVVGTATVLLTWRSPSGGHCSRPTPPASLRLAVNNGHIDFTAAATSEGEQDDDPSITPCDSLVRVRSFQPGRPPASG